MHVGLSFWGGSSNGRTVRQWRPLDQVTWQDGQSECNEESQRSELEARSGSLDRSRSNDYKDLWNRAAHMRSPSESRVPCGVTS
ncbi:hypothetical protein V6N13_059700 [Hibiscus sabdariffa]|uniref:Uncharacterized protein n=2 Tax=Hibiscus sabdariffa TaxID=183260 RepID=A0ABR1Z6G2_9ROSI